jgi:hypothetical protein
MGIEYLKASKNFNFTRPTGYAYPTGLTNAPPISVEYLVVGGGGPGGGSQFGSTYGSGGGGGGVSTGSLSLIRDFSYTATVGGAGASSVFSSVTSTGGGGGTQSTSGGGSGPGGAGGTPGGAGGGSTNYGSSGQLLQSNGDAAPTWISTGSIVAGSTLLTNTYVGYGASGVLSGSSNLTWSGSQLYINGGSLSTLTNSQIIAQRFQVSSTNADYLEISNVRGTTGAGCCGVSSPTSIAK